ncbi:MAG: redoxin domain-containing protein [Bacteroidia bacterium]|nr:redoxin domain-containing protein [Bacteroidia bacterium]
MKQIIVLYLFIMISCLSYSQVAGKQVIISNASSNSIFDHIELKTLDPESGYGNRPDGKIDCIKGNTWIFNIEKPIYVRFSANSDGNWIDQLIDIFPGDSVSYKIEFVEETDLSHSSKKFRKEYRMLFSGKNAANYNYNYDVITFHSDTNYYNRPWFKYGMDLMEYREGILAAYESDKKFLSNYNAEHHLSDAFYRYQLDRIKNEYIVSLYSPFCRNYNLSIPESYFDNMEIVEDGTYAYYKALQVKYVNSQPRDFDSTYQYIIQNAPKKLHEYLITYLIEVFAWRKIAVPSLENIKKEIQNPVYLARIEENEDKLKEYFKVSIDDYPQEGKLFSDYLLENTYLRSYENTQKITLKELLNKYQNKAIYIDIWASWCVPCRKNIIGSVASRKYFEEKKDEIVQIYLSIDGSIQDWLDASKEDGVIKNQYLIDKGYDSAFYQVLRNSGNGIPRYILLDKEHNIELLNAPRSVERERMGFEDLKKSIDKMLENSK